MSVVRALRDSVLLVTIDRPDARNAVNPTVATELEAALDVADNDDAVRVVVITGAGDKSFSAGADLKSIAAGAGDGIATSRGGFAGIVRRRCAKPVIAAVNGTALGGGLEIALACDIVVAAEHATFGLPEVKRGLVAGAGGMIRLPRRISRTVAIEMGTTGDPITAARAYELGLVSHVVPSTRLLDEALALAHQIGAAAPLAVAATLEVMRESGDDESEMWTRSNAAMRRVGGSEDLREGVAAFTEKRAPRWRGR